jgi:hypothetical protein
MYIYETEGAKIQAFFAGMTWSDGQLMMTNCVDALAVNDWYWR